MNTSKWHLIFVSIKNLRMSITLTFLLRSELINEYLQMEQRIDALEKRLARFKGGKSQEDEEASEAVQQPPSQPPPVINQEISSKILAFQSEIRRLEQVCLFTRLLRGLKK